MSATIRQIVDDALQIVGEVSGVGVQTYDDDIMYKAAIRAFNIMFKKRFWRQYMKWFRLQLDGTLGVVSTDALAMVLDHEDFQSVYRDGERRPLSIFPRGHNPYSFTGTGSKVLYWDSLHATDVNYAARKLQFYPVTAVGFVNIHARVYPLATISTNWDWNDVMYLDRDLLALMTAFWTLVGDDLNANAAEKVQGWATAKYSDIVSGLSKHPIPIEGMSGVPTEWFNYPGAV